MVKQTSVLAYNDLQKKGRASSQRATIFEALNTVEDATRQELSRMTGIPINAVCGRVNELLKQGLVAERERRTCEVTGNSAHPVYVVSTTPP